LLIAFWVHRITTAATMQRVSQRRRVLGVPCSNRTAWHQVTIPKSVIQLAHHFRETPMPSWNDESYLMYLAAGDRRGQRMLWARQDRLPYLVLAECAAYDGSFLSVIESDLLSLVTQKSWTLPSSDPHLTYYNGTQYFVELNSATVAAELGLTLHLLGDVLNTTLRELVTNALKRRVFEPLKSTLKGKGIRMWWINEDTNWNAVCWAGVMIAVFCALDDIDDREFFINQAIESSKGYLKSFDKDGFGREGVGYYNYGFANFILLREVLYEGTNGYHDIFADPKAAKSALFAKEFGMSRTSVANFGDSHFESEFRNDLVRVVGQIFGDRRIDLPLLNQNDHIMKPRSELSSAAKDHLNKTSIRLENITFMASVTENHTTVGVTQKSVNVSLFEKNAIAASKDHSNNTSIHYGNLSVTENLTTLGTYSQKVTKVTLFQKNVESVSTDHINETWNHFRNVSAAKNRTTLETFSQQSSSKIKIPSHKESISLPWYLLRLFDQNVNLVKNTTTQGMHALRHYYNESGVLVVRPNALNDGQGLAATFKLGGNSGTHSHNDIGSYVISVNSVQLTGDPGGPLYYNADTFNRNRYLSPLMNSYGHPVPVVNGHLQKSANYALRHQRVKPKVAYTNFSKSKDVIVFDLTGVYRERYLKNLTRRQIYDRESRSIIISDEVTFSKPCNFEDAMVTNKKWRSTGNNTGFFSDSSNTVLNVTINCTTPFVLNVTRLSSYKVDLKRVGIILLQPVITATVTFVFHAAT
jgi:hypothetical protein